MTDSNAELFARAVNEALAPEDAPRAEPETPAGPRRPAPVPEAGHAPKEKPPSPYEQFEQAMKSHFNLP